MQFHAVEPFGPEMETLRAGVVAAAVGNFSGNRKKGAKALGPDDFFPRPGERKGRQSIRSAEDWNSAMQTMKAMAGAL